MTGPYYADASVTLWHGNALEVTGWLDADVLVTDPPYGRRWKQGAGLTNGTGQGATGRPHGGIAGDLSTETRSHALYLWGSERPAAVFGDPLLPPPPGTKQVGFYRKPIDAGIRGAIGGFRRDVEVFYLLGAWPSGIGGRSSVITTATTNIGNPSSPAARYGHPHAKPVDVMEQLIDACPPGVVADPFAGSGSTLVAARNLGRRAVGVELDERYCEIAARRLAQDVLPLGEPA